MTDRAEDERAACEVKVYGDAAHIDIWYPRHRSIKAVHVGLMDVRAADDIRITYDFERDGWKVEQASRFAWHAADETCDRDWQEVAFIKAWAREETDEQQDARIDAFEMADAPS